MYRAKNAKIKNRAFTLVELLVVISIIALLLAVLMPALQNAREQGRRVVCGANQKQISAAFLFYADKYDGYLPRYDNRTAGGDVWVNQVALYIGGGAVNKDKIGTKVFFCPSDKRPMKNINTVYWAHDVSYGYEYRYIGAHNLYSNPPYLGRINRPLHKLIQIKRPSETLIVCGTGIWDNGKDEERMFVAPGSPYNSVGKMHKGGANVLFVDSHVKHYSKKTIDASKHWLATYLP